MFVLRSMILRNQNRTIEPFNKPTLIPFNVFMIHQLIEIVGTSKSIRLNLKQIKYK